jgi:GNAT superfamily N-acetyltransferase
MATTVRIEIVSSARLHSHPWWPALHETIIYSYRNKDIRAFPESWTRIDIDPVAGAEGLSQELGPQGQLAVLFDGSRPIACAGLEPFRGEDWINDVTGLDGPAAHAAANGEVTAHNLYPQAAETEQVIDEWEICCFCVHPDYRGQNLSRRLVDVLVDLARSQGAKRLISNYSLEETGGMWPKLGFTIPVGKGSVLKKGFVRSRGGEGLREDLHFRMGAMLL